MTIALSRIALMEVSERNFTSSLLDLEARCLAVILISDFVLD